MQSYSYFTWVNMDKIVNGAIQIDELKLETLSVLLKVILPNGQTLIGLLVQKNLAVLEKLINKIK